MQSATFSATPAGSCAYPAMKSAFTGSDVAATISRTCPSMASRSTAPSGNPRAKAKPADVVATALNPRCSRYAAVPASHGFGRTKHPESCKVRKVAMADDWASLFMASLLQSRRQPRRGDQLRELLPAFRRLIGGAAPAFDVQPHEVLAEVVVDHVAPVLVHEADALRRPLGRHESVAHEPG